MIAEASPQVYDQTRPEEADLLACLRKIGKGLIASGVSVGVVENTLTEIANVYGAECEIVALPNVVLIQLGHSSRGQVDCILDDPLPPHWRIRGEITCPQMSDTGLVISA